MINRIKRVRQACVPVLFVMCLMGMVLEAGAQSDLQDRRSGFQRRGAGSRDQVSMAPQTVPADLRQLLTPRESEMRIVTQRYNSERRELDGFYDDPLSIQRIAKLKRFDIQWTEALGRLDARRLSRDAQDEFSDQRQLKVLVNDN